MKIVKQKKEETQKGGATCSKCKTAMAKCGCGKKK
jgi:hypothetical protein